jgi:hypothetical protein
VLGPTTENQELALRALKLCQASKGSIAERVYRAWRLDQDVPRDLPSAEFIRRAFGGWAEAEAAFAGRPTPDITALRLKTSGQEIPAKRIEHAIRTWAAGIDPDEPLEARAFIVWCQQQPTDGEGCLGRLPRSAMTLYRKLGRWKPLLIRLGLGYRHRHALRVEGDTRAEIDISSAPSEEQHPMSDEGLLRWLRWIAGLLEDDEYLDREIFDKLVQRVRAIAIAHGQALDAPCSTAFDDRWGRWAAAKAAAGLDDRLHPRGQTTRYSTEEIRDRVADAIRAHGDELKSTMYQVWRHQQRTSGQVRNRIPDVTSVCARLGGPNRKWSVALGDVMATRFAPPEGSEPDARTEGRAGAFTDDGASTDDGARESTRHEKPDQASNASAQRTAS